MTTYRLDLGAATSAAPPMLDAAQQRVVDHEGGPLLVLAGPGTGKTTTMVEAIVRVIEEGVDPSSVLALTFSRKAAEQLRDKVTARLGRTLSTPLASTFHSFAYGLVRMYDEDESGDPLRLVNAAEQDAVIRRLLADSPEAVEWPEFLSLARETRGFASEVQAVMARAAERGADLVQLGERHGRPEWVAAGLFTSDYLTNLDWERAIDYSSLLSRAVVVASDRRDDLRSRFSWVFVDEFQDTDSSQVALLKELAGDGRNLVVVGDPDQSIYGFRGAELRGILEFPDRFRTATGGPAPVVPLTTTRRFGTDLLDASRRVLGEALPSGSIPSDVLREFRSPRSARSDPGRVEATTYDDERAESEFIADALRRAHLIDGVAWRDMAVVVRSGAAIPGLRRALSSVGVPVEVAADEIPLAREPAAGLLMSALRAVVGIGVTDATSRDYVDVDRAEDLYLSPLCGMDASDLRAVAKRLRQDNADVASPELLRQALLDPARFGKDRDAATGRARSLATLLRDARAELDAGATAETVLWQLWSGTDWPERLRRTATAGGPGAAKAHRDLDAICALFEVAARAEEHRGHTSVAAFLDALTAQQIPADTLADRGVRGDAVQLLTAHRSKGLEWDLVVIAHVQEGSWPDLRRRSTLLHADEIGPGGVVTPTDTAELLAEERRLFYVAVTRARSRLLVTAVESGDEDGETPSRFLAKLGSEVVARHGRPARPMSLAGVVAELRRTAADESRPQALRDEAVRRLARLATAGDRGVPLVPQADPSTWWGTLDVTASVQPLRAPAEPISISASTLTSIVNCPARWFQEREAGGDSRSTSAQGFGKVVHTIAEAIAKGLVDRDGDWMQYADEIWDRLDFRTPWEAASEREELRRAIERFIAWESSDRARDLLGTETELNAEVTLPSGEVVKLYGFADRLEVSADGKVWVVDLKTGKYPPKDAEVAEMPQLALYQLAVDHGAVDDLLASRGIDRGLSGGAELWHLRKEVGRAPDKHLQVQKQAAPVPGEPRLVVEQLQDAVDVLRGEAFVATPGKHCEYCKFTSSCPALGAESVLR